MANDKIEIDIVLNDGSIAKGFAKINQEAAKTEGVLAGAFKVFAGFQLSNAVDRVANGLKGLFDDAIKEAIEGEEALNQLSSAMQSAGTFTNESVDSFQRLADRLQNTTKFSDDAVLSAGALARNFTKTNEQAEKLTEAAIQLSAATGRDLNTSIEQLGGTLSGAAGRLGKVVPELNGLTEASLKSGNAIDIVLKRFSGTAENQINTFSGAIAQAKNQFNNFLEDFGNTVVKSPAIVALFSELNKIFVSIGSSLLSFNKDGDDVFKNIILKTTLVAQALNQFLIRPFEVLINLVSLAYDNVKLLFDFFIAGLGKIAGAVGVVTRFFNKDSNLASALLTFSDSSGDVFVNQLKKVGNNAANILDKAFDFSATNAIDRAIGQIGDAVNATSGKLLKKVGKNQSGVKNEDFVDQKALDAEFNKILELQDKVFAAKDEITALGESLNFVDVSIFTDGLASGFDILNEKSASSLEKMLSNFSIAKDKIKNTAVQINNAVSNGLANGISNAVQAFVSAVASGEDAFKAFAQSVLQTFGDLAIQLGTFFVAQGIASLLMRYLDPSGTIAAGLGLIALGSLMKAFFGGNKGSASGGAAAGSSITPPLTPATPVSGIGDQPVDTRSRVQVIVQGNIFDGDATGLRIAELLKEQGFANSVRT